MKACDVVNIYLVSFICNFLKMIYVAFVFCLNRQIFLLSRNKRALPILRIALSIAERSTHCAVFCPLYVAEHVSLTQC